MGLRRGEIGYLCTERATAPSGGSGLQAPRCPSARGPRRGRTKVCRVCPPGRAANLAHVVGVGSSAIRKPADRCGGAARITLTEEQKKQTGLRLLNERIRRQSSRRVKLKISPSSCRKLRLGDDSRVPGLAILPADWFLLDRGAAQRRLRRGSLRAGSVHLRVAEIGKGLDSGSGTKRDTTSTAAHLKARWLGRLRDRGNRRREGRGGGL